MLPAPHERVSIWPHIGSGISVRLLEENAGQGPPSPNRKIAFLAHYPSILVLGRSDSQLSYLPTLCLHFAACISRAENHYEKRPPSINRSLGNGVYPAQLGAAGRSTEHPATSFWFSDGSLVVNDRSETESPDVHFR